MLVGRIATGDLVRNLQDKIFTALDSGEQVGEGWVDGMVWLCIPSKRQLSVWMHGIPRSIVNLQYLT